MKIYILTFLFSILFTEYVISKSDSSKYIDYYNLVNKAKYYEYVNNPNKAVPTFLKAFKIVPKVFAFDKFHLARCYAMKKDTLEVMHWLLEAIKEGFFYKYNKETRTDSLFDFLDSTCTAIINKADEEAFQYYHFHDVIEKKWEDSIHYYFYNDGIFRDEHNKEIVLKYGEKYIDYSLKSWDQLQEKEMNFILKNGYPGGLRSPFSDIFAVPLWHLSVERKKRLKPFLYEELKHGNITPDVYAGFCENLENGVENNGLGKNICLYYLLKTDCPPSDWSKLISNRKSIGLSIYLDQGDYIPYQMKRRKPLPWINQLIIND